MLVAYTYGLKKPPMQAIHELVLPICCFINPRLLSLLLLKTIFEIYFIKIQVHFELSLRVHVAVVDGDFRLCEWQVRIVEKIPILKLKAISPP